MVAQMVKSLPATWETQVRSVSQTPWRREWQPTLVFLPEEFHGQWNLGSSWGHGKSDTTEWLTHTCIDIYVCMS